MAGMTIGKLAAEAGVGVETVRFYQRRGLAFIRGGSDPASLAPYFLLFASTMVVTRPVPMS